MTSALASRPPEQPLRVDEFHSRPTTLERALQFVPILGWIVGAYLSSQRTGPIARRINGILGDRRGIVFEWPSPRHGRIASVVADHIQQAFVWSSATFHPDDHLLVLFYDDDMNSIEIMQDLEEWFGVSLEDVIDRYCDNAESVTFGELVTVIAQRARTPQ